MSEDGDDDYLSDKFLLQSAAPSTSKPLTYAERRRQAQKEAALRNEQNRKKSRRQLEEESREEGLKKTLFERAKEEEATIGVQSKAMNMMLKMGFKPGQSLGKTDDQVERPPPESSEGSHTPEPDAAVKKHRISHRTEPLPIDVWTGKKGLGLGKRAASPTALERIAKVAKVAEETEKETFRERARREFEEKRAEGRLANAALTLQTLDEKAGVHFNVLSLNPYDPDTFPPALLEAMERDLSSLPGLREAAEPERLRRQMQLDALQPLHGGLEDNGEPIAKKSPPEVEPRGFSGDTVKEARSFIQLKAQDRLARILAYLREKYAYCFWCGTQYDNRPDMDDNCPGEEEDVHD